MKTKLFCILSLAASLLLTGCVEKLNLNDIDTRSKLNMGISMPMGSITASLGDFLGEEQVSGVYVDGDGLLFYRDTFNKDEDFHSVDLAQYLSSAEEDVNIYQKVLDGITNAGYISRFTPLLGPTATYKYTSPLPFPEMEFEVSKQLTVPLDGINTDDIDSMRVDSAHIDSALFTSVVRIQNMSTPLDWSWIDTISILLGKEDPLNPKHADPTDRTFSATNRLQYIYIKDKYNQQITQFGDTIPITLRNFTINFVKKPNMDPDSTNVFKEMNFMLYIHFKIPSGIPSFEVSNNSQFHYYFGVRFLDYNALWGWLEPSDDMHDSNAMALDEEWSMWKKFKQFTTPADEPRLDIKVRTQIAGNLWLIGDGLYTNTTGTPHAQRKQAQFADIYGSRSPIYQTPQRKKGDDYFNPQLGWLDPSRSDNLNDTATLLIRFNSNPDSGDLAKLFSIKPDTIYYGFHVKFNIVYTNPSTQVTQKTRQMRVTRSTDIKMEAVANVPLRFNQGTNINYVDTIDGLDFSEYTLDSLMAKTGALDTLTAGQVKVFITANNQIPLFLEAQQVHFLDSLDQPIMDPHDPTKYLSLNPECKLAFEAPEYLVNTQSAYLAKAGESVFIATFDKEQSALLPKVKKMSFVVNAVDPKSPRGKMDQMALRASQTLKLHVGVAATVEAIMDFSKSFK